MKRSFAILSTFNCEETFAFLGSGYRNEKKKDLQRCWARSENEEHVGFTCQVKQKSVLHWHSTADDVRDLLKLLTSGTEEETIVQLQTLVKSNVGIIFRYQVPVINR